MEGLLFPFINRTRFKYTVFDIVNYMIRCFCLKSLNHRMIESTNLYKKHFLFHKASNRIMQELDVVRIVRALRRFKMFTQALLSQKHRMILKFQRQNVIETSSSSSDSDDNNYDLIRCM